MKKSFVIVCVVIFANISMQAQILASSVPTGGAGNSFAFLDGSSNSGYATFPGAGKGVLFPRTNLTIVTASDIYDIPSLGSPNYNPEFYDGLVVFNTGTGVIPAAGMGTSASPLVPGFYYYRNVGGAWNTGVWTPFGGVSSAVKESVVQVVITAGNATATLDLDTATATTTPTLMSGSLLSSTSTFLEAKIYSGSNTTGELKLSATGNYDKTTNILTTGNGLVYQVLPEGTYTVVLSYK